MLPVRPVCLSVSLSLALAAQGLAQATPPTLPLRLDMVHDPAVYPSTFFGEDGAYVNTTPTTAAGYTPMPPDKVYDPGNGSAYGWSDVATSSAWNFFPSDISFTEVEANQSTVAYPHLPVLVPGDSNPEYDETYSLVVNSHRTHLTSWDFRSLVPTGTGRVSVRVLLGMPQFDQSTSLRAGTNLTGGVITFQDVLPEVDVHGENGPGVWARTYVIKGSVDEVLGGWRSIWFSMDTLSDGTNESVAIQIHQNDGQSQVAAIEIYAYDLEDQPPFSFDTSLIGSPAPAPFAVNASYAHWGGVEDEFRAMSGLTALVQDDLTLAQEHFAAIADPVARAEGLLWLTGWLGGERPFFARDGIEWDALNDAIDLLEAVDVTTDPRAGFVAHHLDKARQYRRALVHELLGGVPHIETPDGVGYDNWFRGLEDNVPMSGPDIQVALLNLNAAEAAWRDVAGQELEATWSSSFVELHPLFFKALVYAGINTWSRSTKNSNVSTMPSNKLFIKQFYDLAEEFGDLGLFVGTSAPFEENDSLAIMHHMATYTGSSSEELYDEDIDGGLVQNWALEGSDTVHGAGASRWWDDLLTAANMIDTSLSPCSDNLWARQLRRYEISQAAAHDWWATKGVVDGELGGGDGDDPEFVIQMVFPTLPFPGRYPAIEQAAQEVTDTWLAPWGPEGTGTFFHSDGNPATAADVEHTGEYTSNGLWAMLQLRYGDPWYLEYALQSTEYLSDAFWNGKPGTPWTELVTSATTPLNSTLHTDPETMGTLDYRRFLAWHMDAEGISDDPDFAGDLPLNGRAILPAFYLAAYNRHQPTVDLLRQWAEWWWAVLMDDGSLAIVPTGTPFQKPVGVAPAIVSYGSSLLQYGETEGNNGPYWWRGGYDTGASNDIQSTLTSSEYIYGALLWRYQDTETPVLERVDYLMPLYEASRILAEYWRVSLAAPTPLGSTSVADLEGNFETGNLQWTARELGKSEKFLQILTRQLPFLEAEPGLEHQPGEHAAVIEYLKAGLAAKPPAGFAGTLGAKDPFAKVLYFDDAIGDADKDLFEDSVGDGAVWIDTFFALATEWVSYIDRIYISVNGAKNDAMKAFTHGELTVSFPNTTLSWSSVSGGAPLQIAALAKGWQGGGPGTGVWRALVVNFDSSPGTDTQAVVRFQHGLPPGTYQLYIGENDGQDAIDTSTAVWVQAVVIDPNGGSDEAVVSLPKDTSGSGCGEERVLELREFVEASGSPTSFFDPGVTGHGFEVYQAGGDVIFELPVHNVGIIGGTVDGYLDVMWASQTTPDPPTNFTPLSTITLSPAQPLAGWGTTFDPSAGAFSFGPLPWQPQYGSNPIWLDITYSVVSQSSGDKLENNVVRKTFVVMPPSP